MEVRVIGIAQGTDAWIEDLKTDIWCAEEQAQNGPFYPEKGITRESLLQYAADCRKKLANPRESLSEALYGPNGPCPIPVGVGWGDPDRWHDPKRWHEKG
jgi:hypothetical protein